jgi:MFS family permease
MNDIQPSKFRWFVLVAYVIITTSTSFSMIAPAPLVGEISGALNVDLGVATQAAMASFNLFMALLAFVGGFFLDKEGVVRMWIVSLVILALGSLLMPVMGTSVSGLVFCRFLHAAGTGPIMASVAAISAQRFKPKERTYVAAFQGFSVCLGIALGFAFVPRILVATGSWTWTIAWTAVLPAVALVLGLVVLFGPRPAVATHSVPEKAKGSLFSGDFRTALLFSTFYVLALIGFFDSWTQQTYNALMPGLYAADPPTGLGMGAMGSTKLTLSAFFMMAGTLVPPILTENVFKGNPKPTIFIGLVVSGAAILTALTLTPETGDLMLIGMPCVVLFFSSFVNPTIFGYVSKHYPSDIVGRLGGIMIFFFTIGSTVGQGISGALLSKTSSYSSSMILMAAICFVGALLVFVLRPPKGFE